MVVIVMGIAAAVINAVGSAPTGAAMIIIITAAIPKIVSAVQQHGSQIVGADGGDCWHNTPGVQIMPGVQVQLE